MVVQQKSATEGGTTEGGNRRGTTEGVQQKGYNRRGTTEGVQQKGYNRRGYNWKPLAGGPVETKPTLFFCGLSLSCFSTTGAPGKSQAVLRRLPAQLNG